MFFFPFHLTDLNCMDYTLVMEGADIRDEGSHRMVLYAFFILVVHRYLS